MELYAILALFMWGWGPIFAKIAGRSLSAWSIQVIASFSALAVVAISFLVPSFRPQWNNIGWAIALSAGTAVTAGNLSYFAAIRRGHASIVVTLISLRIAIVALLGYFLLQERLSSSGWLGLLLSIVAITWLSLPRNKAARGQEGKKYLLFVFLAILAYSAWGILGKLAGKFIDPWSVYVVTGLPISFFALIGIGIPNFRPQRKKGVWAAFLAGFVATAGALPFYFALSRGLASTVIPITALSPLVTVILSYFMLKERLTFIQGLGVVIAIFAILLLAK